MSNAKKKIIFFVVLFTLAFNIRFMYPFSAGEKEFFINEINLVDEVNYQGIKEIRIYNPEKTMFPNPARYFWMLGRIRMNSPSGDFKYYLNHELKHNILFQKENRMSYCNFNHLDCFKQAKLS